MISLAEVLAENQMLRRKLSPLENREFTALLKERMEYVDLEPYRRRFRGQECYVLSGEDVWWDCFGEIPTNRDLTELGRSLQALLWERSALTGKTVFVKTVEEYDEHGY